MVQNLGYCFCSSINQSQQQCGFRIKAYLWGLFAIPLKSKLSQDSHSDDS